MNFGSVHSAHVKLGGKLILETNCIFEYKPFLHFRLDVVYKMGGAYKQATMVFLGYIQPAFVKTVQVDDPDGFVDWLLFGFPPEQDVYLGDLKVPIPADVPDLQKILRVYILYITSYKVAHPNMSWDVLIHVHAGNNGESQTFPRVHTWQPHSRL